MREEKRADEPAGDVEVCAASINWDDEAERWVLVIAWLAPGGTHSDVTMVALPCEEGVEQ